MSSIDRTRKAFTLIELLVVIAIIAIIVSLTTAAVQRVRLMGHRAQARADIDQLNAGLNNFRADHGDVPVVLTGGGPNGEFRLCTDYPQPKGLPSDWPESIYLGTIYPALFSPGNIDNGLRVNGAKVSYLDPIMLDANQTAVLWTTGGPYMNFSGLCYSGRQPFEYSVGNPMKKYLDFQTRKFVDPDTGKVDGRIRDPWGTPYAFMACGPKKYPANTSCYGVVPYKTSYRGELNIGGTQIISAGRDKKFGPGGDYTPGQGSWASNQVGADDLANFKLTELGVDDQK